MCNAYCAYTELTIVFLIVGLFGRVLFFLTSSRMQNVFNTAVANLIGGDLVLGLGGDDPQFG